jgi:hypothetical protein
VSPGWNKLTAHDPLGPVLLLDRTTRGLGSNLGSTIGLINYYGDRCCCHHLHISHPTGGCNHLHRAIRQLHFIRGHNFRTTRSGSHRAYMATNCRSNTPWAIHRIPDSLPQHSRLTNNNSKGHTRDLKNIHTILEIDRHDRTMAIIHMGILKTLTLNGSSDCSSKILNSGTISITGITYPNRSTNISRRSWR